MSRMVAVPRLEGISPGYSGVVPAKHAVITREHRNLLRRLDGFEAPYLQDKILADKRLPSSEIYQEAFTEFKKYAALSQIVKGPLGMGSPEVDEVWHQFILFTREYADFCQNYLGSFLHHSPHTSSTSGERKREGMANFRESYKRVFGDLHPIWGLSSDCSADLCGADQCSGCGNQCSKCSSTCE